MLRTEAGGLLGWGWRSCFLINVPIGVAAVVVAARIVPESRAPKGPDLDLTGMVLIASALAGVTLPLIEGREQGWPLWSWATLAAAVALLAAFVAHERRVKRNALHPQVLTLAGLLRATGLGLLLFIALEYRGASLLWLVPGLFLNGLGTGFAVSPLAANVLTRMSPRHVGAASGVLTTGIQVGNAIGVAIIGIIFYDTLAISTYARAFAYSLIYLIAISLLLCAIAQALPRESDSPSA